MPNSLTLKWGTVKSWKLETPEAKAAIQKWVDGGVSISAMFQQDTPEQKQALIEAIDHMDEIWLEWEGKQISRDEAKEYIRTYDRCAKILGSAFGSLQ